MEDLKEFISNNFSEFSTMKNDKGWNETAQNFGIENVDMLRALYSEVKNEKKNQASSLVVTASMIIDWKLRNLTKSEVLELPEAARINYEAIRSAERRYNCRLTKKTEVAIGRFTDRQVIDKYNEGGKDAVQKMYEDAGLSKCTYYKRLKKLSAEGHIDYVSSGSKHDRHSSPRRTIEVDDMLPPSSYVPKEIRSIALGAWRATA